MGAHAFAHKQSLLGSSYFPCLHQSVVTLLLSLFRERPGRRPHVISIPRSRPLELAWTGELRIFERRAAGAARLAKLGVFAEASLFERGGPAKGVPTNPAPQAKLGPLNKATEKCPLLKSAAPLKCALSNLVTPAARAVRIASICTAADVAAGVPPAGGGTGSRAMPSRIDSSTPVTSNTVSTAPAISKLEIGGEGSTRAGDPELLRSSMPSPKAATPERRSVTCRCYTGHVVPGPAQPPLSGPSAMSPAPTRSCSEQKEAAKAAGVRWEASAGIPGRGGYQERASELLPGRAPAPWPASRRSMGWASQAASLRAAGNVDRDVPRLKGLAAS